MKTISHTGLGGLSGMSGMVGLPQVRLLYDTFTDTNGTDISAHTMDVGSGWTEYTTAAYDIQGNKAHVVTKPDPAYVAANAGASEVTVQGTINLGTGGVHVGFVVRLSDGSNAWEVYFRKTDDLLLIVENNAGVRTVRASGAIVLNQSTNYTLKVTCVGTTITGFIDGVSTVTYGSASHNQSATRHGLVTFSSVGNDDCRWDNFEVLG